MKTLITRLLDLDKCHNAHERENLILYHVSKETGLSNMLPLLNDLLMVKVRMCDVIFGRYIRTIRILLMYVMYVHVYEYVYVYIYPQYMHTNLNICMHTCIYYIFTYIHFFANTWHPCEITHLRICLSAR